MGEIADMMIDGTMCSDCGEYIGEGDGFPRQCSSCRPRSSRGFSKGSMGKATKEKLIPLGAKQTDRLRRIMAATDIVRGEEYPGCHMEEAPAKYLALINLGYAEFWEPTNPIHKTRVVITDLGREFLKKEGGKKDEQRPE